MFETLARLLSVLWAGTVACSLSAQTTNNIPPPNDNFANAKKVPHQLSWTDLTSNQFATIEGDVEQALNHGTVPDASASIWYFWSVLEPATLLVDTTGSTFDTVIGVYRGAALDALEPVAEANDIGDRKAAWLKFTAEPDVSYKIAIAGVPPDDRGLIQVRFEING